MYEYECSFEKISHTVTADSAEGAMEIFVDLIIDEWVGGNADKASPLYDFVFEAVYDSSTINWTNEPEDHPSLTLAERNA